MPRFPGILEGQVVAHDIPNRRLIVNIPSAQLIGIGVKMMIHGPADAVRINHPAMPGRGTWGIILFSGGGDSINGTWIGSILPSQLTALTSTDDPFVEYNAHWSGSYEYMDGQGQWTKTFPDGSYFQVAQTVDQPQLTRQTIDANQNQQQTPFTNDQRITNPPSQKFYFTIVSGSGASITIDPEGNMAITTPSSAKLTITTDTVVVNGNIQASGAIIAGFGTNDQVGVQTHRHGTTGAIAQSTIPPSAGT